MPLRAGSPLPLDAFWVLSAESSERLRYQVRTGLVRALKVPDIVIAVLEDLVAVAGALLIVTRF